MGRRGRRRPCRQARRFRPIPTSPGFGANVIEVNATAGFGMGAHGEYFDTYGNANNDTGFSSLQNVASIISGQYGSVTPGSPTGPGWVSTAEHATI